MVFYHDHLIMATAPPGRGTPGGQSLRYCASPLMVWQQSRPSLANCSKARAAASTSLHPTTRFGGANFWATSQAVKTRRDPGCSCRERVTASLYQATRFLARGLWGGTTRVTGHGA